MHSRTGFIRYNWGNVKNVECPEHYIDDFSSDRGYFTEENNTHDWKIENGVLTSTAGDDKTLTYLHIYEKNVSFKARVRILDNPANSLFGLMLRYNADDAFVRSGCYLYSGRWFIDSREGADFPPIRNGYTEKPIELGKWYDLELTVDDTTAALKLDGETLVTAEVSHTSPGRVAIYVERTTLEVDSVDVAFLSGQGTLWGHAVHNLLPDNEYREGGSVFELNDGTLIYENHRGGVTFKSVNGGLDWERCETWIPPIGYMNVLRLNNGDWIRTAKRKDPDTGNMYMISRTSSDDGKTWTDGGNICKTPYRWCTDANAGNMNDKLSQAANGRIFYSQNYETHGEPVNGFMRVFCEFYYSDDNGKTWCKSKTDSWELPGNETVTHFGECKILECADGTLRMYNSWNGYGCVVYSESKDFGETWGPLVKMPELVCARSSMQFVKDKYADNETTYYMVWVYSAPIDNNSGMSRSRLSLAKSTNGKDWEFLGDVWRWEHNYICNSHIAHIVDPFVKATKDYIICGSGISERMESEYFPGHGYHHAQRQHLYAIRKDALSAVELK